VKAVCGEPATPANGEERHHDGPDTAEILRALLDKNLVSQTETAHAERRFAMLETIREYALERLYESGEAETYGDRHAEYYLSVAQEGAANLRGPEQGRWLNTLQAEHDNVIAALEMLFMHKQGTEKEKEETNKKELERVEMGARLCMALYSFWEMRSYLSEGWRWFREAIDKMEATAPRAGSESGGASTSDQAAIPVTGGQSSELYSLLGTMYSGAGNFAYFQSNFREAQTLHAASLAIRRQLGDKWGIASSLGNLGNAAMDQGEYALARRYHTECLSLARELENDSKICIALSNLGIVECDEGNLAQARRLHEEALDIAEKLADSDQTARVLNNLGIVLRYQRNYVEAQKVLTRALDLQSELDMKRNRGLTLVNLAFVARDQGEYQEALRYFLEGLAAVWEAGDSRIAVECLEGLASIEAAMGDARQAAFLFGCAAAARDAIQAPITPVEERYYQASVEQARARLDQASWSEGWSKGQVTSLDEAARQLFGRRPLEA
jgi:tetratricopeptide (TPR) repeat protein